MCLPYSGAHKNRADTQICPYMIIHARELMRTRSFFHLVLLLILHSQLALAQDLAKAKREGRIVFYTSWGPTDADYVVKAFEKKYAFLKVEVVRSSSEKSLQRLLTEQRANRFLGDVVAISGIPSGILKEKGALDRYESPEAIHFPADWRDADGYGVGLHQTIYVIGYNSNSSPAMRFRGTMKTSCSLVGNLSLRGIRKSTISLAR